MRILSAARTHPRLAVCATVIALSLFAQSNLTNVSGIDQTDQPYAFYAPPKLEPGRRYPLLISLHARNITPQLDLRRVFGRGLMSDPRLEATRVMPRLPDIDFFVASPVGRGNMGYDGIAEADVYQLLRDLLARHPIDPNRVYLTGADMGGAGALRMGVTRPDLWAAIALVAPERAADLDERLSNLKHVPVRLYQGDRDPVVTPAQTRELHEKLQRAGVQSEYVELPGVRHAAWEAAYRNLALFEWLSKSVRVKEPGEFSFITREYAYNRAYTLTIDRLTPGQLAKVQVNGSAIQAEGVDAFTVEGLSAPLTINGSRIRTKGSQVSFTRQGDKWLPRKSTPAPQEKQRDLEGPAWAVVSGPHAYVYGTHDNPSPSELERRVAQAKKAGEWSTTRSPLHARFRVIADVDAVHNELGKTALVLFGDKRTNAWIARYADRLPLELQPGAADYGLLFVAAIDGRYLMVNSGLPWWTRADQARRAGLTGVPAPWEVLRSTGDYLVFKGGLDNVIAEGRFDRFWNLSPDAAALIHRSGAVSVRPGK